MTLVEVLVALTLLAILSAGLISSFGMGRRTYESVVHIDRAYWDVVSTQRFMREAIESAYPFEPDSLHRGRGLEGRADRCSVTAPSALADQSAGYRRYSFWFRPGAHGEPGDLMASSAVDRNGADAS